MEDEGRKLSKFKITKIIQLTFTLVLELRKKCVMKKINNVKICLNQ